MIRLSVKHIIEVAVVCFMHLKALLPKYKYEYEQTNRPTDRHQDLDQNVNQDHIATHSHKEAHKHPNIYRYLHTNIYECVCVRESVLWEAGHTQVVRHFYNEGKELNVVWWLSASRRDKTREYTHRWHCMLLCVFSVKTEMKIALNCNWIELWLWLCLWHTKANKQYHNYIECTTQTYANCMYCVIIYTLTHSLTLSLSRCECVYTNVKFEIHWKVLTLSQRQKSRT